LPPHSQFFLLLSSSCNPIFSLQPLFFVIFVNFSVSYQRPWAQDCAFFYFTRSTSYFYFRIPHFALLTNVSEGTTQASNSSSAPVILSFIDCQKSMINFVSLELQFNIEISFF
jgi:hypothetical protein